MGLLREDLYYRLQANVIEIPPLRERSEDIPLLTSHFIKIFNAESAAPAVPVTGIAQDAMAALLRYPWPGNVRELSNAIESAITFGRSSRIRLKDLPQNVRRNEPEAAPLAVGDTAAAEIQAAPVRQLTGSSPKTFDETERELIERALQIAGHNKTYAAELLQISRKKLYARLAKYGLLNRGRRARRGSTFPHRRSFALRELTGPGRCSSALPSRFHAPRSVCAAVMGIVFPLMLRTCMRLISGLRFTDFI